MEKLVSIITPSFNSKFFLKGVMLSIVGQSYTNWEWIIIDDCSTDGTWSILQDFMKQDERIRCFRNKSNKGSGASRNFAIEKSKGVYIAFLDSDDLWYPNKLKEQILFMQEHNAVLCHTSYDFINDKGESLNKVYYVQEKIDYQGLLKKTDIGCLTAIYNSEILGKRYMSNHKQKQDYFLWLSILKEGFVSHGLNKNLASYRVHKNSATSNKFGLIYKHYIFLKETQNLSWIHSFFYTLTWIYNGTIKHYLK